MAEQRVRGRRAGGESARDEIVRAALAEFGEQGYDATSVRGIARRAGVDPGLVRYYFPGGKGELFAVAVAERDVNPVTLLSGALAGGMDGLGTRLLEQVLKTWDANGGPERFRLLFAAASSGQDTVLRDFLTHEIFGRLVAALPGPDVERRVALAVSQAAGVLVARYVLRLEPIASADPADLARAVGPTLQRYLVGPVPGATDPDLAQGVAPGADEEHYSSGEE